MSKYWKRGAVMNPKTGKLNRLGGEGAYKSIKLLLKQSPTSTIHWKHIKVMAKRGGRWGSKMQKLIDNKKRVKKRSRRRSRKRR